MIAKLSTGNGFGGATSYLLRNGESDEERAKVKVLAASGVDFSIDNNGNIVLDARQVARDFRFQSMMMPSVRKPVYDIALSWKVGEHVPSDEKRARTEEFMQMIGFENTQYIIVEHEKENEHSHAIANIVDNDGNRISTKDLIDRMHAAAREITKKYGYQWGDTAKKETVKKAHKPHEKARYTIEPKVKEAVAKANDIKDLPGLLKFSGIGCNIKYSEAGKPVGISFSVDFGGQLHTFKGSDLDRSLSAGNIAKTIADNKRIAAEKLSKEPEVFVIHGKDDATLFMNRHLTPRNSMDVKLAILYEAARSILSFKTWGASIVEKDPDEFVRYAVNGQQFGTVKFDIEKARFVGEDRPSGMIENPEEVIKFADHNGQALDLFTPEFWDEWNRKLTNLKEWLARLAKKTQSARKEPAPVPQKSQPAPAPQPVAKPTFEVIREFRRDDYRYRIKKERDGTMKLQRLEPDKRSPVVNGEHSGYAWYNKALFTSYKDVGHDADGIYLKISDTTGKTRYIDQNGNDLNQTKKKQLGLVSKGYGGPSM